MQRLTLIPRRCNRGMLHIYSQHVRYRAERLTAKAEHLLEQAGQLLDRAANLRQIAVLLRARRRK